MGYRSQVAIAFDSSLLPIWRKHTEKHEEWIQAIADTYCIDEDEGGICTVQFDYVKWYIDFGFEEIDAMDAAISDFDDDPDHDGLFQFLRVGEELADIEEKGCLFRFNVHRTIEPA